MPVIQTDIERFWAAAAANAPPTEFQEAAPAGSSARAPVTPLAVEQIAQAATGISTAAAPVQRQGIGHHSQHLLRVDTAALLADELLTASSTVSSSWVPEPTPPAAPVPTGAVGSRAEAGYALLAAGNRKAAAAAFRQAIAQEADDPRVPQWRAQLAYLERRWSGMAYMLARNTGKTLPNATIPALTAAQSGALVGYTLNPLSRHPLSVEGRVITANDGIALNTDSAQAAVALSWRPIPALRVAAERLIAASRNSRDAWTLRAAAGGEAPRPAGKRSWTTWSAYGEAGVVGTKRHDLFAASAVRVGRAIALSDKASLAVGAGVWGSVQHYDLTAHWIEVGPTVQLRVESKPPVNVALDYRVRINGNADPGTGPALTVSSGF